jgi:hypothetical protein
LVAIALLLRSVQLNGYLRRSPASQIENAMISATAIAKRASAAATIGLVR